MFLFCPCNNVRILRLFCSQNYDIFLFMRANFRSIVTYWRCSGLKFWNLFFSKMITAFFILLYLAMMKYFYVNSTPEKVLHRHFGIIVWKEVWILKDLNFELTTLRKSRYVAYCNIIFPYFLSHFFESHTSQLSPLRPVDPFYTCKCYWY